MKIAIGVSGDLVTAQPNGFIPLFESIRSALEPQNKIDVYAPRGGDFRLNTSVLETLKTPKNQYYNTVSLAKKFAEEIGAKKYDRVVTFANMGQFLTRAFVCITTIVPCARTLKILRREYPKTAEYRAILAYYALVAKHEKEMYERPEKIIVFSEVIRRSIVEDYGVSPKKVIYIPKPIPVFASETKHASSKESEMKIILMPAELRVRKGIRYAIETMKILKKELPGSVLVICGRIHFQEQEYVRQLLEEAKGKANIAMTGFLPKDKLYEYMKKAECAFMPFCFDECPVALGECIGHGLPVVTNEYAGFQKEIIEKFGYCCKQDTPRDYADALMRLLTDQAVMDTKRKGALSVAKKFTSEKFAQALNDAIA